MTDGSFQMPTLIFPWPTGEFGGMSLEDALN
jgi:hypothetical protein